MEKRIQTRVGFLLILFGGLCFANPVYAYVDVLPDALGALLLCAGLQKFADLNETLSECRISFRNFLFVGLWELFSVFFFYFILSPEQGEMQRYQLPTLLLLFCFVSAFFRFLILRPALNRLFEGLGMLADYEGAETLGETDRHDVTFLQKSGRKAKNCLLFQAVVDVLPEFAILTSYEFEDGNRMFPFDWYRFIDLFRVVALIFSAVAGICFAVVWIRCFLRAEREHAFRDRLSEKYTAALVNDPSRVMIRRFRLSLFLLGIAAVFAINVRVNDRALLPGVIFAFLSFAALFLLGDLAPWKKPCYLACALLALVSIAQIIVNSAFLSSFLPEDSLYETDAYFFYFAVKVVDALEIFATLVLAGTVLYAVYRIATAHTKTVYEGDDERTRQVSVRATERLHKEYRKRLILTFVLFFLAAGTGIAESFLRLRFGWAWVVPFCFSVAANCVFGAARQELNEKLLAAYPPKEKD